MRNRILPAVVCLASLLLTIEARAFSVRYTKILESGDPLPGGNETFTRIDPPLMQGSTLAFTAELHGTGGITSSYFGTRGGLFLMENGNIRTLARNGQVMPGTGGYVFEDILPCSLKDGLVAFNGNDHSEDFDVWTALYIGDGKSPMFFVADYDTLVPGTNIRIGDAAPDAMGGGGLGADFVLFGANVENGLLSTSEILKYDAHGLSTVAFNAFDYAVRGKRIAYVAGTRTVVVSENSQEEIVYQSANPGDYVSGLCMDGNNLAFRIYSYPGPLHVVTLIDGQLTTRTNAMYLTALSGRHLSFTTSSPDGLSSTLWTDTGGRSWPVLDSAQPVFGHLYLNVSASAQSFEGSNVVFIAQDWNDRSVIVLATLTMGDPVPADYDGDGRADLANFDANNTTWSVNGSAKGNYDVPFHAGRAAPADYDGDSVADVAVFDGTAQWHILGSASPARDVTFGFPGAIPVPADYNGDGKADIAVFNPKNGRWFFQDEASPRRGIRFGNAGMQPVPADYDGDGRADLAAYDPRSGIWNMKQTSGGLQRIQFGAPGMLPVPADYDGDGKTDIAVYDPISGNWFLLQSSAGFRVQQFGFGGITPVPADYDGDGKMDIAVYHPTGGDWYILASRDGFMVR